MKDSLVLPFFIQTSKSEKQFVESNRPETWVRDIFRISLRGNYPGNVGLVSVSVSDSSLNFFPSKTSGGRKDYESRRTTQVPKEGTVYVVSSNKHNGVHDYENII